MDKQKAEQLKRIHEARKGATRSAVLAAVNFLEERGRHVTFTAVAELAGVNRSTLYRHPELKELILKKRGCWHKPHLRQGDVIAALKAENRRLRAKVDSQRSWIEVLNDHGPVLRDEDVSPRLK